MPGGSYVGGGFLGGGSSLILGGSEPGPPIAHERILSPLGEEMRDSLPPALRESADYLAVIQALSRECERAASRLEEVRRQFNPAQADRLLGLWERLTRQTVEPMGKTLEQRQADVTARLRQLLHLGEGKEWVVQVTALIGIGWSYEEHIAGDSSTPPEGTLRIMLPFDADDTRYLAAQLVIPTVTPAHLEIEFASEGGFLLDDSRLDVDEMTV